MESIFTAEAISSGNGRNGHVSTKDGLIDTDVRVPREMGGEGGAPNPELFFAAGFAACFHSALHVVARKQRLRLHDSRVGAGVRLIGDSQSGYHLGVDLVVTLPDIPHDEAVELADAAHLVCPYSNATRGNVEVTVTVTDR